MSADDVKLRWPEAIARLTGERTRAITLAGLLKKHGNEAQRDSGALIYGEGKSEIDAVVGGLLVVVARIKKPTSLPDLEERLKRAVDRLAQLGELVSPLVPQVAGEKSWIGDILSKPIEALLKPLTEAVAALWNAHREDNSLVRSTINTQLEATRWPDFAAIETPR